MGHPTMSLKRRKLPNALSNVSEVTITIWNMAMSQNPGTLRTRTLK